MVGNYTSFINDTTLKGVVNGITENVTGDTTLTYFLILLFIVIIGFVFRLEPIILMVLMTPIALVFLAFGLANFLTVPMILILAFIIAFTIRVILR